MPISGSSFGIRFEACSIRMTLVPSLAKNSAISQPVGPPPTMKMNLGWRRKRSAVSAVRHLTESKPIISPMKMREPVARTKFSEVYCLSPIATVWSSRKCAKPRRQVMPCDS